MSTLFKSEQLSKDDLAIRLVSISLDDDSELPAHEDARILGFPYIGNDPWIRFSTADDEHLIPLRRVVAIRWANEEEGS